MFDCIIKNTPPPFLACMKTIIVSYRLVVMEMIMVLIMLVLIIVVVVMS